MRPLLSVARTLRVPDRSRGSNAVSQALPRQRRCGTRGSNRHNVAMPMREECKNFESRTYANGETVRKCNLDLAPDAPWRCPDHCVGYERRLADVQWTYGSLVTPRTPDEPPGLDDGSAAAVLDEAEEIINAIGPELLAEAEARDARAAHPSFFGRLRRRRKR